MPGIPDRWEAYTPLGRTVGDTNFIPFKVPLKLALCQNLPEMKKFTPSHLLNMVGRLGLVIDLTNTCRYYNPEDFISSGVRYVKILCQGHGNIPSPVIVRKFYDAVHHFLNENKDGLIGVHCTHGLNRTGYLICRYMIENLGYSAENAIKEFNKARGHDIERPEYLRDLYKREEKYIAAGKCEKIEARVDTGGRTTYPMKYKNETYPDHKRNLPSNSRTNGRSYHQSNCDYYHVPPIRYQDKNTTIEIKTGRKNNGWDNHSRRYRYELHNESACLPSHYAHPVQAHNGNRDRQNRRRSFASFSQKCRANSQSELN